MFICAYVLVCIIRSSLYSPYNVCGSLGVEWGLRGDTAVWADKVPGSQSQTGPTGNEKVLLSPLCHFAIPEKRREAWQRRRWRRAAQNGPGTVGSTCHCSCWKEKDVVIDKSWWNDLKIQESAKDISTVFTLSTSYLIIIRIIIIISTPFLNCFQSDQTQKKWKVCIALKVYD